MLSMKSDKSALALLAAECEALDLNAYEQDEALESFKAALAAARAVLENPAALNETSIEPALAALSSAKAALHAKVPADLDLQVLETVTAAAGETEKELDRYVIQGQSEFLETLTAARSVLADPQDQNQVDQAAVSLHEAWLNLRLKADETLLAVLREGLQLLQNIDRTLYSSAELAKLDAVFADLNSAFANHDAKTAEIDADTALALGQELQEAADLITSREKNQKAADLVGLLQKQAALPARAASAAASVSTAASTKTGFFASLSALAAGLLIGHGRRRRKE